METTINKTDIVKLMREIRDQFSLDIMNMSFGEQKAYLKKHLEELKNKRKKIITKSIDDTNK
ncbi:MAG: hypothetical protein DRJ10_12140 [Bacteroidetes bacterium]|nr:MAG: hypothetical protein DRJ10_12140 [Bacteroidota bacterium]